MSLLANLARVSSTAVFNTLEHHWANHRCEPVYVDRLDGVGPRCPVELHLLDALRELALLRMYHDNLELQERRAARAAGGAS